MKKVTVYRFTLWDHLLGINATSKRPGTREAIAKLEGKPIEESAEEVEITLLDIDGFVAHPKPTEAERALAAADELSIAERDHLRRIREYQLNRTATFAYVPGVMKSLEGMGLVSSDGDEPKLTDFGNLVAQWV